MIVRVSGEGQYELDEGCARRVDDIDHEVIAAVEAGDEPRFHETWLRMLELIEGEGRRVPDDALVASDVILPPRDISFAEAQREFTGEGLLPGI